MKWGFIFSFQSKESYAEGKKSSRQKKKQGFGLTTETLLS